MDVFLKIGLTCLVFVILCTIADLSVQDTSLSSAHTSIALAGGSAIIVAVVTIAVWLIHKIWSVI